jgi:hypothetical protein
MSMESPEKQNLHPTGSQGPLNGLNKIELTAKAMKFVEGRKQDLTTSQYVSMLLENLYTYTNQQSVSEDDQNIVDIVEGKMFSQDASLFDKYQASWQSNSETVKNAIETLKKTYGEEIPFIDFYELCRELGLGDDEIELEAKRFSAYIMVPEKPLDQNTVERADGIYDYLRSVFGKSIPIDIFKNKCIERGITPREFESLKNRYGFK